MNRASGRCWVKVDVEGGGWAREEEWANADHPGNAENDKGPSDSAHGRVVDALVTMQRQVRTVTTARAASTHVRSSSFFFFGNIMHHTTRRASRNHCRKRKRWVDGCWLMSGSFGIAA